MHLELFSISPNGSTSTTTSNFFHATWPFFVVVKVDRFGTTCALCPGGGLRFVLVAVLWCLVGARCTKRRRLHCGHYWANWVLTHSFSVYEVRLLQVLNVVMHLSMSSLRGEGGRATHGNLAVMPWHHAFDLSILKEVNHLFLLILTIIICPGVGILIISFRKCQNPHPMPNPPPPPRAWYW